MSEKVKEAWGSGDPYEHYVGRWSRRVAGEFLAWLDLPSRLTWGDVGCGTGALVESMLALADPQLIFAIDRSAGFISAAQANIPDQRVRFEVADATALPWTDASCEVTVSGLVLNFVPDPRTMVREQVRVTRRNGTVAAYVWDYRGGMAMMRQFWAAAIALNPKDAALDQAERFPLCQPEPLQALFEEAGLHSVSVRAIDIPTLFRDFDDFWQPFLGRQGAAPTYLASLDSETRDRIRE
ncbi:MAG TPA: methyltransferase domain-containing protein, partial [Caldilineaceae bacterium]|nr:methyltransferase domain-containing protein [Caldilineaceae bacterium]